MKAGALASSPLGQIAGSKAGPFLVAIAAGAIGFAVNQFGLAVLGGTEVIFGGVLSLLMSLRYGGLHGGIAALIAFSATWIRWGHPMGVVCYTGEAVVVGWLLHHWRVRPLSAIGLYWLFIGGPAVAIYMWRDVSFPFPSYLAIAVKYPLNTLLIVGPALALFDIAYTGAVNRVRPWAPAQQHGQPNGSTVHRHRPSSLSTTA